MRFADINSDSKLDAYGSAVSFGKFAVSLGNGDGGSSRR
jgi:hypothetical protein